MASRDFTEVVARMSRTPAEDPPVPGTPRAVTVLGAGPGGRALAAWLLAEGTESVTIFSVYSDELAALDGGSITLRGGGPVGTFRIGSDGIRLTSVLDDAVTQADAVVVTGPTFKLRTYGLVLAPHLGADQLLVVAGSRTFGALEMDWWLEAGGNRGGRTMLELPSLPFDVRPDGATLHLERRRPGTIGVRPAHRTAAANWLADMLGDLAVAPTTLHASFAEASGLVEVPALVLGGQAMGDGSQPLLPGVVPVSASSFRSLLAPRALEVADRLAGERRAVAAHFGVRDLPTTEAWVDEVAGGDGPGDLRPVPTVAAAEQLVREGTLGSLVPISSAGRMAGEPTPATDAVVAVASTALGSDLAAAGRTLEGIGFAGADPAAVRRAVGVIGAGDGR